MGQCQCIPWHGWPTSEAGLWSLSSHSWVIVEDLWTECWCNTRWCFLAPLTAISKQHVLLVKDLAWTKQSSATFSNRKKNMFPCSHEMSLIQIYRDPKRKRNLTQNPYSLPYWSIMCDLFVIHDDFSHKLPCIKKTRIMRTIRKNGNVHKRSLIFSPLAFILSVLHIHCFYRRLWFFLYVGIKGVISKRGMYTNGHWFPHSWLAFFL